MYLSNTALQSLLHLCERTTQFKSLEQRRVIALLAERISLVPAEDGDEYMLDALTTAVFRNAGIDPKEEGEPDDGGIDP